MEQLAATSILSLFQTTKEERQSFVSSIVTELKEGNKNPLDIHLQIKCMEELAGQLKDNPDYKKAVTDAAIKQLGGSKSTIFRNAEWSVKEAGVKYDYSGCNDPVVTTLAADADKATKELKQRQDFLKGVSPSGVEVRIDDELITIYPPTKISTTTVNVSLK